MMRVLRGHFRASVGLTVGAALALLLGGCGNSNSTNTTEKACGKAYLPTGTLTDLDFTAYENALNAVAKAFDQWHPGDAVTVPISLHLRT